MKGDTLKVWWMPVCSAAVSARGPTEIIYEILDEMEGKHFYPQDPEDGVYMHFFLCSEIFYCSVLEWDQSNLFRPT